MTVTLNGWRRLWIAGSGAWLIALATAAALMFPFPTASGQYKQGYVEEIYRGMPPDSARLAGGASHLGETEIPDRIVEIDGRFWGFPKSVLNRETRLEDYRAAIRRMPNGDRLTFAPGSSDEVITRVTDDYISSMQRIVWRERTRYAAIVGVVWAVPCVILYALGSVGAWVVRGFRGQ
jgi:hypothetical protein